MPEWLSGDSTILVRSYNTSRVRVPPQAPFVLIQREGSISICMPNFNEQEYKAAKFCDHINYKCSTCENIVPRLKRDIATEVRRNRTGFRCDLCWKIPAEKEHRICKNCQSSFVVKCLTQIFCNTKCAAQFNHIDRQCVRYRPLHKCDNTKCNVQTRAPFCSTECSGFYRQRKKFADLLRGKGTAMHISAVATAFKRYLIYKRGPKCFKCGWSQINPFTNRVPIEINHIDGNCANNNLKNLELVCPNCHSLTQHHKGANKTYNGENPRYQQWKAAHERRSQQSSNMPS